MATCLRGNPSDSSQEIFLEFQSLAQEYGAMEIRWTRGHSNVPGNEQANALLKAERCFQSLMGRPLHEHSTKGLGLEATTGCPLELALLWPMICHLLAARTHYGDFATYHESFHHDDTRPTCSCRRRKDATHVFNCRKIALQHRMRLAPLPVMAVN